MQSKRLLQAFAIQNGYLHIHSNRIRRLLIWYYANFLVGAVFSF